LKAKRAIQARWSRSNSRPLPKPLSCPKLGRRPPRGIRRWEWEADRAKLMEHEESLSALRKLREDELGRPWTKEGTINVIETVINLMTIFNLSKSAACDMLSVTWHKRKEKVLEVVNAWMEGRQVLWRPPNPCGAGSPRYPESYARLDSTHQLLITDYMRELNEKGGMVNADGLQTYLRDKCNVEMSLRRIRQQLIRWGCTYDFGVALSPVDRKWHERRISKFIVAYAKAMQLEENGMHVIVYMDESYIHNNHSISKGWFAPGSSRYVRKSKHSGRWVMFHAITKDGLLFAERRSADGDLTQPTVNAEYIYHIDTRPKAKEAPESASNTIDIQKDKDAYHGNIDGDMFILWLHNRLILAFEAKFPGKKMILVMDNASYHNPHEDDWVPVSKMRKEQVIAAFKKYTITSFTMESEVVTEAGEKVMEQRTFDEAFFSKDKRRETREHPIPGVNEMKKHLSGFLKQHPELVMTRTRRIMQERGWQVLFTPPLEPRCQPIEELWGVVKNTVAQQYLLGRTMNTTLQQLLDAFYTHSYREKVEEDKQLGPGVTARHCRGMIQNSRDWMEKFIREHSHLLAGDLTRLTYINDLVRFTSLSEEEEDMEDTAFVDREARLESEEDWDFNELGAAEAMAGIQAQWGYLGPQEETEEERDENDCSTSSFPKPGVSHTAAPALLMETAPRHFRPVVAVPRSLVFTW
jgi:hypothetical protein